MLTEHAIIRFEGGRFVIVSMDCLANNVDGSAMEGYEERSIKVGTILTFGRRVPGHQFVVAEVANLFVGQPKQGEDMIKQVMHTGWVGGGGGHLMYPLKRLCKNCNIKMHYNTKIEDPFPDFLMDQVHWSPNITSCYLENVCL